MNSNEIIKAEMWDKMQFLFRNYYDRMIHVRFDYKGIIDKETISASLMYTIENIRILHSSFQPSKINAYWKVEPFKLNDFFEYREVDKIDEKEVNKFLSSQIPYESNIQLKVLILATKQESVFLLIMNHMCMDGGGLKELLRIIVDNYNKISNKEFDKLQFKVGSRNFEQVYTKFNQEDSKAAKRLFKDRGKLVDDHAFPWTKDSINDVNRVIRHKITSDKFLKLKEIGKEYSLTVNDLLVLIAIRALYEVGHYDVNSKVVVACAVDLRKHIKNIEEGRFTNHTAWMICLVNRKGDTLKDTLLDILMSLNKNKRDKFLGLYRLPLLKLAYGIFPAVVSEKLISKGYSNPLLAISNIGILREEFYTFKDTKIVDGFMSGAVKYKPFFLLSATTLLNEMTLSTAIRGNDKDEEIAKNYFSLIEQEIDETIKYFNTQDK